MYTSKHYTCEQIDERLLQGYYDDAVEAGYNGTLEQFQVDLLAALGISANGLDAGDVNIPPGTGLESSKLQAALAEIVTKSNQTNQALGETVQALNETNQALNETNQTLNETNQTLNETQQSLNETQQTLNETTQQTAALEQGINLGQDSQGNAVKPSDVMKMNVENEYVYTLTDKDNHILFGITKEGKVELVGKDVLGNISLALEGALEAIHATMLDEETSITDVQYLNESVEWIKLIQDADGGIIFGIRTDGSVYWAKGVPDVIKDYVTKAIASSGGGGEGVGGYSVAFTKYALDMAPLCKPLEPMGEYSYVITDSTMSPTNEIVVIDSSNNLISA